MDDKQIISVSRNGAHMTSYNCWKRWGGMGVFIQMLEGLSVQKAEPQTFKIDATYLKAHNTASGLRVQKGDLGRLIRQTKGGFKAKSHAVTNANCCPLNFFITAGQVSDYTSAVCSMICPRPSGCSPTTAKTLTGLEMRWSRRATYCAFLSENPDLYPSNTTRAV